MLRRFIFHTLVFPPAPLPAVRRIIHCRGHSSSATGDEVQAARAWLAELHAETIPFKSIGELSFSRSSGPGGQNVNKVNSKATLKVPLDALLHHIPAALHGEIRRSRYVAARSNAIIVQADDSRKQSDNAQSCYRRIYEAIARAGQDAVPAETSAAQVQRVKQLQKADNERRLKSKKQQSAKKTSRRSRGDE
ncbi:hypothetical protein J4E90_001002 [Alternaria incomplexa]|uniref:uncharacterized protein n=1 Tax=Alternaria incomplexa TaxID=1187928 RepID=UPI00221EC184|nr:uncharacterized protein J4E90_001002 [Alternaria incomplexa]XP_051352868.1 uncharacterized protein J4E92_005832 [Alternaria infectoria]KAI4922571.1 hypothetical protein J4E90_001002 [Alternaria incomplexa]KAI4928346.1 hypothetical protein J4E92_005832 [Alternaria infectoria]